MAELTASGMDRCVAVYCLLKHKGKLDAARRLAATTEPTFARARLWLYLTRSVATAPVATSAPADAQPAAAAASVVGHAFDDIYPDQDAVLLMLRDDCEPPSAMAVDLVPPLPASPSIITSTGDVAAAMDTSSATADPALAQAGSAAQPVASAVRDLCFVCCLCVSYGRQSSSALV